MLGTYLNILDYNMYMRCGGEIMALDTGRVGCNLLIPRLVISMFYYITEERTQPMNNIEALGRWSK